ncbi:hypothetical protein FA95DRAFT_653474 [Auriscalpium vulgare]|uniref:Uncharacterized protein n=1 Tax=Auriscalpium vulgare TaxID=40419 RepID=A0ACB8RCS6_9AGAM|nr:hypothetical protein FA95DRAFT_653474 [Auriscalpium vulgare]
MLSQLHTLVLRSNVGVSPQNNIQGARRPGDTRDHEAAGGGVHAPRVPMAHCSGMRSHMHKNWSTPRASVQAAARHGDAAVIGGGTAGIRQGVSEPWC